MKEALAYEKLPGKRARCLVCQRRCLILEGKVGFCLTKMNQKGKLYTLNYGIIQGIEVDPIEKKPFYHFHPGTLVPSIGSYGCNFRCKQCLNWWCSWGEPATSILKKATRRKDIEIFPPEMLIEKIKKAGYKSIAFTYNEPVVWAEYVLDAAALAREAKLLTFFVTNGSWSKETLDKIGPFIDAANVDFKGFSEKTYARMGAFFGKIPQMTKYAQEKHHIFIEITTLLIPGINNGQEELKKMTSWMVNNLGPKTPWHLSQYSANEAPDKKFQRIPPTTIEELNEAANVGKKEGLEFIYIWAPGGNLGRGPYSQGDTLCPKCGALAIRRTGWKVEILGVNKNGRCLKCKNDLNVKL